MNVGERAPDFTLTTESGATVSLLDACRRGPVVLIFYPMDNTPGCTAQLCAVRNDAELYKDAGVAVYGVNGGDAASHQKFIARHNLTAPLLIDTDLKVAAAYDAVLGFGPLKMIRRTVVGIGTDGRVAFYQRGTPPTDAILAGVGHA